MVTWEKQDCGEDGCTIRTWMCDATPPDISLVGLPVKQKGRTFYVVKGEANELDRLCHVPRIDFGKGDKHHAKQALSGNMYEWQRPLNPERVVDISRFFASDHNFIVNAALIGLPQSEHIEISEAPEFNGVVVRGLAQEWMNTSCPNCGYTKQTGPSGDKRTWWFDHCPEHSCHSASQSNRPAVIIDGQHRIRGIHGPYSTESSRSQPIAATLLPSDEFPPQDQAEIFTEITTTAEDLETVHKLYLLYQFGLSASRLSLSVDFSDEKMKADFRENDPDGKINRRAYEIICKLCSGDGLWENRISILGEDEQEKYIDIQQFLPMVSSWMVPGGSLEEFAPQAKPVLSDIPIKQLNDYLRAIRDTWPKAWEDDPDSNDPGPLQSKGIFSVLALFFDDVASHLRSNQKQRSLPNFVEALQPFSHISWGQDWEKMATPEKNKSLLYRILTHKLSKGKPTDLNSAIGSSPGAFAFSKTTRQLQGNSFTSEMGLTLEWERPLSSWKRARVLITQGEEILYNRRTSLQQLYITPGKLHGDVDTDPGAEDVELLVRYSNNQGATTTSFTMKP